MRVFILVLAVLLLASAAHIDHLPFTARLEQTIVCNPCGGEQIVDAAGVLVLNGLVITEGVDYTRSGSSVTFVSPLPQGSILTTISIQEAP